MLPGGHYYIVQPVPQFQVTVFFICYAVHISSLFSKLWSISYCCFMWMYFMFYTNDWIEALRWFSFLVRLIVGCLSSLSTVALLRSSWFSSLFMCPLCRFVFWVEFSEGSLSHILAGRGLKGVIPNNAISRGKTLSLLSKHLTMNTSMYFWDRLRCKLQKNGVTYYGAAAIEKQRTHLFVDSIRVSCLCNYGSLISGR